MQISSTHALRKNVHGPYAAVTLLGPDRSIATVCVFPHKITRAPPIRCRFQVYLNNNINVEFLLQLPGETTQESGAHPQKFQTHGPCAGKFKHCP